MDDDGLEYPDEDLDLMIDEELEIERELELERQLLEQREKENRGPSPPALAKATVSPRALRATDCNVGLSNNVDLGTKRTRSQGDDFPPMMGSTSPAFKRFKGPTSDAPRVHLATDCMKPPREGCGSGSSEAGRRFLNNTTIN